MIIVGSANARVGMSYGWEILQGGGPAIDAVEAVIRAVEDNEADHTVGFAGYPNALGQVELDASIMVGEGRRAGAVGALRGYRQAITVARAVMERTPHVLIVGEGAALLARELGLEPESLLTAETERLWREKRHEGIEVGPLSQAARQATDPEHVTGTVNVMAIDRAGRLVSGVSTSGWAWKYPGRLGDSPIIGAGNYADQRYGAAACTGWGELAIRSGTAGQVVAALARGAQLDEACAAALQDLGSLAGTESRRMPMNIVALDASGGHAAFSTRVGSEYVIQQDGMAAAEIRPRQVVTPW